MHTIIEVYEREREEVAIIPYTAIEREREKAGGRDKAIKLSCSNIISIDLSLSLYKREIWKIPL